ncbi:LOW QUALITY PROTEIN: sterol 3-beta-glucosyltransferase [Argentina anserina]|uniref:LOW QUALITY PROTEIN: sterol 3-beta-glucosyltransferase n=1 Tax=Argentina anserina TaxID=57926 RepID=UPI0021764499|nr:LOW QUALITY PROTEIN: sterol 3-beta-glucosyltransferase [Potentilla anserina]
MEIKSENTKPIAVFMAFGTKGDVFPIAAIASAFACDKRQYQVVFITHSAHQSLRCHLAEKQVYYVSISSPPVLSIHQKHDTTELPLSLQQKHLFSGEHRKEYLSVVEMIFGSGPSMDGDFIVINFFALEGWSLAELFHVRCMVAAPYVVPFSAPSSFERHFKKEYQYLYKYLQESHDKVVCWEDVIHWMWPLFTEHWGSWRCDNLNLSPCPFTDPVTGLPMWHDRPLSPRLLYGFSKEVVECPDYWPSSIRVCGFWFLPNAWQFSCMECSEISRLVVSGNLYTTDKMCPAHIHLQYFLETPMPMRPDFIGLNSIGSMGFLKNFQAFLRLLETVLRITSYRFILFTAGHERLDAAIRAIATDSSSHMTHKQINDDCVSLFQERLFCFSGSVPYTWLFSGCAAAIHHGGSGTTAAGLLAGIPQVICPFMLDQFYWAERMFWLGVAPEPWKRSHLLPEESDDESIEEAANLLATVIHKALSPEIKERAVEISKRISLEDGVSNDVRYIKEEFGCSS